MTLAVGTPPEGLERLRATLRACAILRSADDAVTPDAPAPAAAVQAAGAGVGVAALGAAWAAEAAAEGGQQRVRASGRQQLQQQQQLEEHEWVMRSNKVGATNRRMAEDRTRMACAVITEHCTKESCPSRIGCRLACPNDGCVRVPVRTAPVGRCSLG